MREASEDEQEFYEGFVCSLAERRYALGWTQEQLNNRLGVADGLVAKWECLTKFPSALHLMLWANALRVEIIVRRRA